MKLKDAVRFVNHNGCSCHASDQEHYARVVLKDGSPEEITGEILNIYGNDEVLDVNVIVELEGHELMDYIIYEFYLDI